MAGKKQEFAAAEDWRGRRGNPSHAPDADVTVLVVRHVALRVLSFIVTYACAAVLSASISSLMSVKRAATPAAASSQHPRNSTAPSLHPSYRRKLSTAECVLLWLTFAAIMNTGLEMGIFSGIVMATLYHAYEYAQVSKAFTYVSDS